MKQCFSSVGKPACWKWQETPRLHSPFCHALHGCLQLRQFLGTADQLRRQAGGVAPVLANARALNAGVEIQIEVESIDQLREALAAGARSVLLDNFPPERLREAVAVNAGLALLAGRDGDARLLLGRRRQALQLSSGPRGSSGRSGVPALRAVHG